MTNAYAKVISISHLSPPLRRQYVLTSLAGFWRDAGFRIEVAPQYATDAHVCILHHDLTRLDPTELPTPANGLTPLNGRVLDISKRRYSTLQLQPDDPWTGQVIVKSNLNHFGAPELRRRRAPPMRKLRQRLARVSWRHARMLPKRFYPVLESIGDVPAWVWRDPGYIVEKFMPERLGDGLFAIRGWLFFGNAGYAYRLCSRDPLVKTGTMVSHEFLSDVPEELWRLRREMNFDFGKFDFVMHEGRAFLLDANKTPSYSGEPRSERLADLAKGIEAFL